MEDAPAHSPADVVVIAGPTASGKSGLALRVAAAFGGAIINADSMQVYHELSVLTARPGADALARAPHRLYGFMPAAERCSAARWSALARQEVAAARRAGRLPVLVGGTGLYLSAFADGLAPVPAVPEAVRRAAAERLKALGPARFHAEVAGFDPEAAARLPQGDRQRLQRAWEVHAATGLALSAWQRLPPAGGHRGRIVTVVVDLPRDLLYRRCDARLKEMVAAGAVDEAVRLGRLGLDPGLPAMRALGVPELRALGEGRLGREAAIVRAQTATRRYAKRQLTWLRHRLAGRMAGPHRVDGQDDDAMTRQTFAIIRRALLTGPAPWATDDALSLGVAGAHPRAPADPPGGSHRER